MRTRLATPADAAAVASIYNGGIEERTATLQTTLHEGSDFLERIDAGVVSVAEDDEGAVIGAAWTSVHDPAPYYAGVREATVYVSRAARRHGAGRALLAHLSASARERGAHKLVAKVFATNAGSRSLFITSGFREVGTYHRHGCLEGEWKDVTLLERLL